MLKRSGLLAVALLGGLAAGNAQAQCGGMYGGFGGYGGYWDIGRLYGVLANNVPYYSAFPPVYYSVPVPRSYGYSPFAYPPGTMTPEVAEVVSSQEIVNPYVEPASLEIEKQKVEEDQVTVTTSPSSALVISNPFVAPGASHTAVAAR